MVKFNVNGKAGAAVVSLPTHLSEITPEYLNGVTCNIKIGDNYSLIGIVYRESLSSVIMAFNQKRKEITTNIVPIFIRSGNGAPDYINNIKTGDKLIIAGSDIAMGHHVNCPMNRITVNNIVNLCEGDKEIYRKAVTFKDKCCFIEFKLVPNCNIHGSYSELNTIDVNLVNSFVKFTEEGE